MQKILITEPIPTPMLAQLKNLLGDKALVEAVTTTQDEELAQRLSDTEILLNGFRKFDANTLALAPKLRFIQQLGVGYNNLDLDVIAQAGIIAANTPRVNAQPVAEHTIMLMMVVLKRFVEAEAGTRANIWHHQMKLFQAGIGELGTSTIGLVGFGAIGQAVAERLKPFGAQLLYTARHQASLALEERLGVKYVSLPELLASASIVSLHLPLNPETRHLIGSQELSQMKPGSILINTSRGELIDEKALRQALESDRLAGAGLDVLTEEADGKNNFADLPQVVVTPHLGGLSQGAIARTMQMACANVLRYLGGEKPLNIIPEGTFGY